MNRKLVNYQERPIGPAKSLCMYNPYRTDVNHPHSRAIKYLLKAVAEEIKRSSITLKDGNTVQLNVLFWTVELQTEREITEVLIHLNYKDLNNLPKKIVVKSIKQVSDIINRLEEAEEYLSNYSHLNRNLNLKSKVLYEIGTPQRFLLGEEVFIYNRSDHNSLLYEVSSEALPTAFKLKETTLGDFLEQYPYMASFLTLNKGVLLYIRDVGGKYAFRMEGVE